MIHSQGPRPGTLNLSLIPQQPVAAQGLGLSAVPGPAGVDLNDSILESPCKPPRGNSIHMATCTTNSSILLLATDSLGGSLGYTGQEREGKEKSKNHTYTSLWEYEY